MDAFSPLQRPCQQSFAFTGIKTDTSVIEIMDVYLLSNVFAERAASRDTEMLSPAKAAQIIYVFLYYENLPGPIIYNYFITVNIIECQYVNRQLFSNLSKRVRKFVREGL